MTLTFLDTPGRIGPGLAVTVASDVLGPIAADDYCQVLLQDSVTAALFMQGEGSLSSAHAFFVPIGVYVHQIQPAGLNWLNGVDGYALSLIAFQYHASGGFVDASAITPGWSWDAVSGLWVLVNTAASRSGSLAAIEAAVIHTFPAT